MPRLSSTLHLTSHPIYLDIRGPSVYEDDKHRTWLHLVMETGGVLQVLLHQEDIPGGYIPLTTGPLTSSTMPLMWTIQPGNQYLDSMGRFWRIVRHVKENGLEKMTLELKEDS
ncbi:T-cell leukemia/lymphoma protein 1A-like [Myotis daubentonii]|uniref:T-cell leukemia/lymphoma protein 1A-like n=1 Tax=Myotis daubentonii TaxID=98922 RepID=UPI002872B48D|nr:T-cell leukemia/lymphoma protein 1A-like [Myotis daubentonii]